MMRPDACREFASRHFLAYLTIADLVAYREQKEMSTLGVSTPLTEFQQHSSSSATATST
jgi:hypothetical protein